MTLLCLDRRSDLRRQIGTASLAFATLLAAPAVAQQNTTLVPGNLVVSVEGCGVYGGTCTIPNGTGAGTQNSSLGGYGDNQAAPLTLLQFSPVGTTSATYVNSLVLPQTASGGNLPVSGEYGSSSEATLQLSTNGQYLAVLGYGINAATFDANPSLYGAAPSLALGQSGSLTGQSYTPVPRVLALIDADGNVSSSTAVYNIFNTNNPRSTITANGTTAYFSGQGASGDTTGGVFYTTVGAVNNAPMPITGLDTTSNTVAQDTREVQLVNDTLFVSVDTKAGSGSNRDYLGTLGAPGNPPTTTVGAPVMLNGFGSSNGHGQVTISGNGNNLNNGLQINLSPENYFFASPSVLFVADSGDSKQSSASSTLGDGGLQKWINTASDGSGTWNLAYTLYKGLNLVANTNTDGVSGLYGLAGRVVNGQVQLYATSFTLADLDPTSLYGITDTLSDTTAAQAAGESFSVLANAPSDSNFKGVSFTPTVATANTFAIGSSFATQGGGGYLLTLTVTNSGSNTAQNVVLSGITVGGVSAGSLPVNVGPIAAGSSATVTVSVPANAGSPGSTVAEKITGTYSGGAISSSARASLPGAITK